MTNRARRPRFAPPRPTSAGPDGGLAGDLRALDRRVRDALDPIARRLEGDRRQRLRPQFWVIAAAWRTPFWLWAIFALFSGFGAAAPFLASILGFLVGAAAAIADIVALRLFALGLVRDSQGRALSPWFRWAAASAAGAHAIAAGAVALIAIVPILIGVLGGYAW